MIQASGFLTGLKIDTSTPLRYHLCLEKQPPIPLNAYLGQYISLNFSGKISCIHCHRSIKKSYNNGYCYVCFTRLARCDQCIVKPELCHFHLGTCRETEWGEKVCMRNHIVYLSVTSGIKVGITRKNNIPNRWYDQGATLALPIFEVPTRRHSGFLEVSLKKYFHDKTNWRKMLSQDHYDTNLSKTAADLFSEVDLSSIIAQYPPSLQHPPKPLYPHHKPIEIHYPHCAKLDRVSSFNVAKNPLISGKLIGMKGQYLILDTGVIQIKKHQGYWVDFQVNPTLESL